MVSGGTVTSELSSINSSFKTYTSEVSGLSGSWKGASHDNLEAKSEEFVGEYQGVIQSEMEAFATACNLYDEYTNAKSNLKIAKENLSQARKNEDDSATRKYRDAVNQYEEEMEKLKEQIESNLSKCNKKLASSSSPFSTTSVSISGFSGAGYVTAEVNGQMGTYLSFDENAINNIIGKQTGADCGVYAMAYGFNVLEGKCRLSGNPSPSEIRSAYNGGSSSDEAYWGSMGCSSNSASNSKQRLDVLYDEITQNKKPVIVATQGSSFNHYVLAVGIKQGATKENLKPSDIIVLDSAGDQRLHYYGEGYTEGKNFDGSDYGLQYITFPDVGKVA